MASWRSTAVENVRSDINNSAAPGARLEVLLSKNRFLHCTGRHAWLSPKMQPFIATIPDFRWDTFALKRNFATATHCRFSLSDCP